MFWQSGQTKAGWHLKLSVVALFQDEYRLQLIDPTAAAYIATFAEHFSPFYLSSDWRRALQHWRCCS